MRWQMAHGADEQRGPMVLYFPRDRALWTYEPSSEKSGTAQNVSPWADPYRHPLSVRGVVTAIQGSARWIYFAVENLVGETWIVVRDTRSGMPHIFAEVGSGGCHFIGITALLGMNPKLLFGNGTNLVAITLPLDGDLPQDDPACLHGAQGSLWLSEIDLGFPDEDKLTFSTRIIADDLVPEHQYIQVWQSADGGPYELLGTAAESPRAEIHGPARAVRRLGIRLDFFSDDPARTPKLYALTVRMFLNTRLYRTWQFTVAVPSGSNGRGADWLGNAQSVLEDLWEARMAGFPVGFIDRWGKPWEVRIFQLTEQEVLRELDRPPETHLQVVLLEVQEGDQVGASWSSAPAGTGPFIPITLGA